MRASDVCFRAAVLLVLAGMSWGLFMAISKDHSGMTGHAHLNLLGWVSLFLIGIFYRLHPEIDRSRIALVQVAVWIVAVIVLAIGLGLLYQAGRPAIGEPMAAVSSMVLFADMILFAYLVFRRSAVSA